MTIDQELREAETILGHQLGRRPSDNQLALAAIRGHCGRPSRAFPLISPLELGSISEGFDHAFRARHGLASSLGFKLRRAFGRPPLGRVRWRLPRAWQLDQGNTPQCVAYTFEHIAKSLPMVTRGKTPAENYARAKQLDGQPDQDGTWGDAMLQVYQEQNLVESHWWWRNSSDNDAVNEWLRHIGPLGFGAYWPETMFRTDKTGNIEVGPLEGVQLYGHEVEVIGWNPRTKKKEIVQSWGNDRYGIKGRGYIRDEDFWRLMANGGDLVGIVEKRP